MSPYNCLLHEMVSTTPTQYWNDSCSVEELQQAIANGATGATSNPVIVFNVLKKEMLLWRAHIQQVIAQNPTWSEMQVSWQIYQDLAVNGAKQLLPLHESTQRRKGRLSIQTDPAFYNNREAILQQAEYFHGLAPNMQVKIPATQAGISMVEEATYRGVNLNITVSFSVPQVIAAAEAIERGLRHREAEGKEIASLTPVVTMMVGRLDDWLKVIVKRENLTLNPDYLDWAGVTCFRKAYQIFQERKYRSRLLVAAYRNMYHWKELVGGEITHTIPYEWQVKYNESGIKPVPTMHEPVKKEIVDGLLTLADFRRAYDEKGMTINEFDHFGATVRTLRSFIEGWHNFVSMIRDVMLPNPDVA